MLSEKVSSYIAGKEVDKLEKHDKETDSQCGKLPEAEQPAFLAVQQTKRAKIQQAHSPDQWLTDASKRAAQIQLATHATKYIHSDAKASSVNAAGLKGRADRIGSHRVSALSIDVTGNAAVLDVANLLLLVHDGEALWQQISSDNRVSLKPFSKDDQQLTEWMHGFRVAISGSEFASHTLGKQTYFPVGDGSYHLIAPLFPTSLCHEMYGIVQSARFGETAKQARAARKAGKGAEHAVVSYTNSAEMTFGGSKPQNISLLNSQRRGVAYLLSCAPPVWQNRGRLPVRGKAAFWKSYHWRVRHQLKALNRFLDKVQHYNNVNIRNTRRNMVSALVDNWLSFVASIRELGSPGWSLKSELSLHEQCLLDPKRRDDDEDSPFNHMIDTGEWKIKVSDDFAQWLNRSLSNSKRDLADAEAAVWAAEIKDAISVFRNDLERFL